MNYIKSILLIILLIPTISHSIYRIYTDNIGQDKAEFYFDDVYTIYLDDNEHQVKKLSSIGKNNDVYKFKSYYVTSPEEVIDEVFIKKLDSDTFNDLKKNYQQLTGDTRSGNKIDLHKIFEYDIHNKNRLDEAEFNNIDFLQENSTKDFYFKLVISKKKKEEAKIVGIKVFNKKDGHLIQNITGVKAGIFESFTHITTGNDDYNFDDDNNDFSIGSLLFNGRGGARVIAEYYSYDKKQKKYVKLNLKGNDIRLDSKTKTATDYKLCFSRKTEGRIELNDTFQYMGNNHYKQIKTKCLYKEDDVQRACTPQELINCRKCLEDDDNDEDYYDIYDED